MSNVKTINTGISELDRLTGGLRSSDITLIASRPDMEKTSFLLNIASNIAIQGRKKVAFFSQKSAEILYSTPFNIYDLNEVKNADQISEQLRSECYDLVVIDSLQWMTEGLYEKDKHKKAIIESKISHQLYLMAKALDLPIILTSTLYSEPPEIRDTSCPMLSDLRESGSLEQNPGIIIFLYKESDTTNCYVAKNRYADTGQIAVNQHLFCRP